MRGLVVCTLLVVALAAVRRAGAADELSVEEVARRVRGSVVTIRHIGRGERDQGLGTGFVVAADGLVATNLHVIGEARPVSVELADGSRHDVIAVHAVDRAADLAIVRIARQGLAPLALGDPKSLADGQEVVAVGNPHGLERSVVAGRVSGKREIDGRSMIQLAIPIEPGNSGGPLLDRQGRVHGVLTMKSLVTPSLGFAVAADRLTPLLADPNPVSMERWLTIGALDPSEWTALGGARWRQRAGRITVAGVGTGFGGRSLCLAVEPPPAVPYEVATWVKLDDESGAAGLVFTADGGDRHHGFYPSAGKLRLTRFDGPDVTSWNILRELQSDAYRPGEWNHLRVRREAGRIVGFVNDVEAFAVALDGPAGGRVGLAAFRGTEAAFRGFAVGRSLPPARPDAAARDAAGRLAGPPPADGRPAPDSIARLLEGDDRAAALRARSEDLRREAAWLEELAGGVEARKTIGALVATAVREDESIDLLRGALLVAKLDDPALDVEASVRQLERLARDVAAGLPADADEAARRAALDRVLFSELGFHGSRGDYYNRANSYVSEVLDDREGIPITLAVVYMELARRLGLVIEGVGLPGHFIVRHDPAGGEPVWIDVFDGGKQLDRAGVAALLRDVQGIELVDDHLAVVGPRAILVRILGNLIGIAEREDRPEALLRYLDATLALEPETVSSRVRRMIVATRLERLETALADARWLLDNAPEGVDLDKVRELVTALEERRAAR
ncbi:MAG: trypsin-like serine protease [Planctomycetes bacterium]|nr:trypsin-like serine protease [Planctomycetota bacterium]